MLNTNWMKSAKAAVEYLSAADYYATSPGMLFGKGFEHLDISGMSPRDVMQCLAHNLDPATGKVLRPHAKEGDRIGMDFTFNSPKSVGLAREMAGPGNAGDPRVEWAHREAVLYAMGHVEKDMQTRVRVGGANENRVTGNCFGYVVTHRETRINAEDGKPDPSLHDHFFLLNLTRDTVEGKFKAAEVAQIKHDAPFYEAVYMNRLASNLKKLGYGIERKGKSFEIAGVSRDLIDKFSRRTKYIESVAEKLGIVNPKSKAKLGATTRLGKAKELADDLNGYYVSRLTEPEKAALAGLEGKRSREVPVEDAVGYAIGHMFERQSVVDEKRLYETALRYGVGSVTTEGVQAEAKRQGVLVKDREATTREVLAEEARIIAFARDGRGTCRPMGNEKGRPGNPERPLEKCDGVAGLKLHNGLDGYGLNGDAQVGTDGATVPPLAQPKSPPRLSAEQSVMVNHVLTSTDRVILTVGDAGTGKTFAVKSAFQRIGRPIEIMAPGAEASRGVLRRDFDTADTVTAFLNSPERQARVKNGVIWVDESGQLPIRDLSRLVDVAKAQNARLVLQGDPKQHRAVARDGNMMRVLETHAGLPVARLRDIRRQTGDYRAAVSALADGRLAAGFDALDGMGWVQTVSDNTPLVDAYVEAVETKKPKQDITDRVLAIAPTHAEANEVTAAIRERLKQKGLVCTDEHLVENLVPMHWTDAEKGDMERYEGTEVLQWHRRGGTFQAGDRLRLAEFRRGMSFGKPSGFSVFRPGAISLAAGDRIRITSNGWTADEQHRLDNGSVYTVDGFEKDGRIRLTNGWHVAPGFKHLTHGYVATSHASQGKTVDRVLIAMGSESLPAISREQFYVSVSRGRDKAMIFTDVDAPELRAAVQKADARKSATELMQPSVRRKEWWMARRARAAWEALRGRTQRDTPERHKQREQGYGR